jgi:hypothetical protein
MRERVRMRGAKIATIVLAIADVVVWSIPALIYVALWTSQYAGYV